MRRFDSLVHITRDGQWLGRSQCDASLARLLKELDRARIARACLVGIPEYADNETVEQAAHAHPSRFVPVAGINPAAYSRSEDLSAAVGALAARGFAAIKLHPRLNGYDPLDSRSLAAIAAAGRHGLPAFLCTFYRHRDLPTRHPSDVVDQIATTCPATRIVLLHGGGTSMMDLFELVRMHEHLVLDLSFSLMRYRGSSMDMDMRFLFQNLDQKVVVGSDFPEYSPCEVFQRVDEITEGLPDSKRENILFRNLAELFGDPAGEPS